MAFEAIILVNVTGDHTKSAYKTITRMEGIKSAFMVTGVYDLVVHVAARDLSHLGDMILTNIRSVDGVTQTMTCLVLSPAPPPA
ncbi:MAG: Lrp/AsnC ligand binding domain-containing protein [Nitrospiria bacterium]